MSALAWIFGLGALAVAFPLLFHLIRRTPTGQTEFSSLMFLKPTPPTLTRRSRLENILLLLMRAAAIILIAAAFMRPFFPSPDALASVKLANRRVAILVDTSASMQRTGLWEQAKQQVKSVLDDLEAGDDVALLAFDRDVRKIVEFVDGNDVAQVDRAGLIRESLESLEPGWERSDLGKALIVVADNLDVWRETQSAEEGKVPSKLQIVVISDLQQGTRIESLQSYQWPDHVYVKFQPLAPADYSNATVQLLPPAVEEDDPSFRVRVANSDESKVEQFVVNWSGDNQDPNRNPIPFYVPAGTSRVLKVPPDQAVSARQFVVNGDADEFDNTFYVVPVEQTVLTVAYLGNDDANDPEAPQYYFRRALVATPSRLIQVRQLADAEPIPLDGDERPSLIVLSSEVTENRRDQINRYLATGGSLLVLIANDEMANNIEEWTSARPGRDNDPAARRKADSYLMLAEIDFSSPVFRPFANPRYNDFTKIRFWKHRPVELIDDTVQVVARFDNDDPAVWINPVGEGTVYAFASGWQPADSQLGLSSKFVPLVNGLVELAADLPELDKSLVVGEPIEFPATDQAQRRWMLKPDGTRERIEPEQTRFDDVDRPGIYQLVATSDVSVNPVSGQRENETLDRENETRDGENETPDRENETPMTAGDSATPGSTLFAVNVDRSESETTAIPVAQIETFDVKVGEQPTAASELAQMRVLRDRELENQQKIWKWLIVTAMLLLIGETWLAGRTADRTRPDGATTSDAAATHEAGIPTSGLSGEMT